MAANNLNDNNNNGFHIEVIKNICVKYKKYLAAGVMVVLLAAIIKNSVAASGDPGVTDQDPVQSGTVADTVADTQSEELKEDEYPEINALIEQYYGYYAAGDTDAIEKLATPITETEKSYIQLYSQFVEKYDNIKCYTKKGISDGEFIVSAALDTHFKGIKTPAPGLVSFYVRTNEEGAYYIDNAYSNFNQPYKDKMTETSINILLTEYTQDEDVMALGKEIRKEYEKALEEDADLKKMVTETIQDAIHTWVASVGDQTAADDTKTDNTKADDTKADDTKTDDTKTDDSKADDTSDQQDQPQVTKRTAYAKTEVNMREKRSINSESLRVLDAGTEVTVYGESKKGWLKVKVNGEVGFVRDEYIVSDKSEVEKKASVTKRTAYAKTTVNLRKKRSTDSKVLKTLKPGTKVTVYGKSKNGWLKIKVSGKTGFVKKEYIVYNKSKVEKEEDSGQNTDNTTSTGPSYYSEGDRVTLTQSVNIRQSMSEGSDRVALAYQGDVVTVIMSYAEGWTKVSYNGQSGFVKTEVLR